MSADRTDPPGHRKVVPLRDVPESAPWWDGPLIRLRPHGRPRGVRQWLRAAWNFDVFLGPVPAFKLTWLFALVVSRC